MIRRIVVWIFLMEAVAIPALVRAEEPAPGRICEKVVCRHDPKQTYALYLPSNYLPDRKWPVLYALDAGARGALPVARFKDAAEKYGYIVAGSNNSQNGPIEIAREALSALLTDTESRFALDERRVYMTGFSGGARLAVNAAVSLKGKVAGVIACGAGFPLTIKPSASGGFAFFGAVGDEDFNFPELRALDDTLEKLGVAHGLEIFKGGHDWPPESVCTRAIEWLELQAMKSGIKARNTDWIDAMYSKAVAEANACESNHEIYAAYQRYSALARDFSGFKDTGSFKTKATEMGKSREVKKAVNQEKTIGEQQAKLDARLKDLLDGAILGIDRAQRVQELVRSFIDLREKAHQTKNEADHLVATRILALFWVRLNESTSLDFENKDYGRAALRLELMTEIRPENPRVFYHLARARALGGDKKGALKALNTAVAKGFKDAADLKQNADFENVRGDPAFQALLSTLEKK